MVVSESAKEERIAERKLIVHKTVIDLPTAKDMVNKEKTGFFAKLGFLKPKPEEIDCEAVSLYYEPYIVVNSKYSIDYYKKNTYSIEVDEKVNEVIIFGQSLKPEAPKKGVRRLLRRPYKEIKLDAQERVIHEAAAYIALDRTGREIDFVKLPSAPAEAGPEKVLKELGDIARKLKVSPDNAISIARERVGRRPPDTERVAKEIFEVTEHAVIYTPIYEARCRNLKTGEIKIIPISGVTGKTLSL